jgi:hypothetical protein
VAAPDRLADVPLYLDGLEEMKSWNVDFICKSLGHGRGGRREALDREHEFVFVDHLHRIPARDRSAPGRSTVKTLTNMALDQNLMLVVLCQLRKQMRGKDTGVSRPVAPDFRETSQIADDASWRWRSGGRGTTPA